VIIELRLWPDHNQQINHLPAARGFGEGQDDAPALVSEHDEDEEDAEPSGGHGEEVERDQVSDMIGEERSPRLGGRGAPLREQPGDGAFGHIDAEFK
jgi:hypothetical protein